MNEVKNAVVKRAWKIKKVKVVSSKNIARECKYCKGTTNAIATVSICGYRYLIIK